MEAKVKQERRPVTRPNSFIFTLFGDLAHRAEGEASLRIGSLIALMAPFGVSEAAVRQAVSRMSRQGWLRARRTGGRALYALTPRGRSRVADLSPRIYGPVIEWDGNWRLLTYTIEERSRAGRDRLRTTLGLLGWAPLSASTWISPAGRLEAARAAAQSCGVAQDVHFFVGPYRGPLGDRELVARCWDLPRIAGAYDEFVARYEPGAKTEFARGGLGDQEAFVERLWLVHDYRKVAFLDPGLPSELVPAHWPGTRAAALFRTYDAELAAKAQRYVAAAADS